jgi:hypothetical protein
VWDLEDGTPLGSPLTGHEVGVWAVAVGELHGRPVVVSGSGDGTMRVWSVGETIARRFEVDSGIIDMKLLPNGLLVIAAHMGVMVIKLASYEGR